MPSTILLADFDLPTRSASGFLLRWIAPRLEPVHLYGVPARRFPFRMSAPQSDVIIATGHGQEDALMGQHEEVVLKVGEYSLREVDGKVIKILACLTGVILGPDLISSGASAVLTYKDDYVWVMDADLVATPWGDKVAATCLMPVVDSLNVLLDGRTSGEALEVELSGYVRNAEVEEDDLIRSLIKFNKENAVLLGDPNSRVSRRPALPLPFKLFGLPPLPPIVLVGR